MKKQILKIAGVKSEKEFYKKFHTEEAFMAKHGKELKKAQIGTYMTSEAPSTMYQPADIRGMYDELDYQFTGMTSADRAKAEAVKQAAAELAQSVSGGGQGGGMDMGQVAQFAEMAGAKKGKKIPSAQRGRVQTGGLPRTQLGNVTGAQPGLPRTQLGNVTDRGPMPIPSATPTAATTKQPVNWAQGIPIVGKIASGIQKSREAKQLLQQTIQQEKLTDVMGQAAASRPVQQPRRQYVRPEDVVIQPEQMFPSYGVGTNVLAEFGASVGGGEIMNTYAPGTLYDNLGYEPLNDSDRYKQFYHGGKMHKAQNGLEKFMSQQGGNEIFGAIDQLGAFSDGGGDIGSGIGEAIGSVVPIPGAKQIFTAAGRVIGSALDQKQEETEAAQERSRQNMNKIIGQSFGIGVQQQFGANLQDGGTTSPYKWVSHTWQPQVITTFGEHKVKDLLRPPADADMLRAGGHLKEYTPPSARAMSTERPAMQMGGELQTHWGGYAEPMSYNPYLPDGGETIMFRGQSHDESDGRGNTGIGITYGDNPVEVERGEPAVKLQDGGTGESNLTVFGNIKITNAFADMLADSKAKGKKFKTYVADLSKQENKQNKLIDKSLEQLDELNVQTSFDKLALGTLQANIEGANAKLKDLADKKMNAASLQNAINDTKEENLLEVTDKGDVLAKKGANIPKAQGGISRGKSRAELANVDPAIKGLFELFGKKNYDVFATSGYRDSTTTGGRPSRHSRGEAMDITFPTLGEKAYETILNDPDIAQYMLQNNITAINEYDPETQKVTGATGPHIHFGFDKGTPLADKFRNEAATKYPTALTPIPQTGLPKINPTDYQYLKRLFNEAKQAKTGPAVLKFQQEYHRLAPEYAKSVLSKFPVTAYGKKKGLSTADLSSNEEGIFGDRTIAYDAALDEGITDVPVGEMAKIKELEEIILPPGKKNVTKKDMEEMTVTPYKRNALMDVFNSILPYIRPSDIEELDPNQLIGEMFALSQNQVEPVWAQKFTPELSTPIDISLQDILNENEASFRSQQRMFGYNPAAQSMLNAQKYQANQRVLGEQFRLNQAEKQRVYEQNRNLLNQAELQNLQILERQADKQAMALSKTKATTQEALNSIASKYAQNKLQNRTLAVMENMYNYRYSPGFRAMNMNPLWQPNIQNVGGAVPIYDKNNKIIGYKSIEEATGVEKPSTATPGILAKSGKSVKKMNLNGSIVKALKNI